jgi:hypothetical protein
LSFWSLWLLQGRKDRNRKREEEEEEERRGREEAEEEQEQDRKKTMRKMGGRGNRKSSLGGREGIYSDDYRVQLHRREGNSQGCLRGDGANNGPVH